MTVISGSLDAARRRLQEETPRDRAVPPAVLALSRRDAARALGMSLSHFQRHVQPEVRCVYSGQLRLYPVSELEAWLERQSCDGGRAA